MEERLHLKGLNGLRAIAAVSVVLAHTRSALPEFFFLKGPFDMANYGVIMFFSLSGFLITYLLYIEKKQQPVNIRNFYIRRILRIWPLYFAYLVIAIITTYFTEPEKLPGSLPYYLFFLANIPSILNNHLPHLAQYWTLGMEEQFYMIWPWIIKKSKNVLMALIIFTGCFLALKLFFRFIYFKWDTVTPLRILAVNCFDCMAIGGIAAILCLHQHRLFLTIVTNKFVQLICWLSLPVMAMNLFHVTPFLDNNLVALVTVTLIVNVSFNSSSLIKLENRFFDFLGKISYGMYIMHPLIIFYFASFLSLFKVTGPLKIVLIYSGVMLLTILCSWLSYEFFEKRFLLLKDRYSRIKSSGSKYM